MNFDLRFMKSKNLQTLEEFKDKHFGKVGSLKRDKLEAEYEHFKKQNVEHPILNFQQRNKK